MSKEPPVMTTRKELKKDTVKEEQKKLIAQDQRTQKVCTNNGEL